MSDTVVSTYGDAIREALREMWPGRNRPKALARTIGVSHHTVRAWDQGRRTPSAEQLIELIAAHPAVEAAVMRIVEKSREAKRSNGIARVKLASARWEADDLACRTADRFRVMVDGERRLAVEPCPAGVATVTRRRDGQ